MTQRNSGNSIQRMSGKVFGMALMAMLSGLALAGTSLSAQQPATAARTAPAQAPQVAPAAMPRLSAEKAETAAPQKPGHEGLKVHGHWKIVSRNPDGSIASTYEFENSLYAGSGGDKLIALLLTSQAAIGELLMQIGGNGPCSNFCLFTMSTSASDPVYSGSACTSGQFLCFGGETIAVQITPSSPGTPSIGTYGIVLTGSFTAPAAGNISSVSTLAYFCSSIMSNNVTTTTVETPVLANFTSASCLNGTGANVAETYGGSGFTGTVLSSPFTFAASQLVQVSVTITFS